MKEERAILAGGCFREAEAERLSSRSEQVS